jgi:putative phosphoribosyl transferase
MEERLYSDREEAGRALAGALGALRGQGVLVLALPRGGVPVAFPVARALGAPLDVFLARKLGAPMHPELGMGALTEGGTLVLDEAIVRLVGASRDQVDRVIARERTEIARRRARYREDRELGPLTGRVVVLVDDGVATGGTARAALRDLRSRGPARLVFAVPVGAREACALLAAECDEVVCLETPSLFHAIGEWYDDFRQLTDAEVLLWLERARREHARAGASLGPGEVVSQPMSLRVGRVVLEADVRIPTRARGVVVFAHGSGSGRKSPRNVAVADELARAGFATVLFDLLTPGEGAADVVTGRMRFDVPLLSKRLEGVVDLVARHAELGRLPLALFGASTGAAAALAVAAERPALVRAVVSRGGRPDLAGESLGRVRAPVLLVVGGRDGAVLELNRGALGALGGHGALAVVPGASHLFEEPGALEHVSRLSAEWLERHLVGVPAPV